MAQLISVNATRRVQGSKDVTFSPAKEYGFDVEDIVVPIRNNGTSSYFTARQLKGTNPSSRSVGNTDYEVEETLSEIAAKSDKLVLLNVVKRDNVDFTAPEEFVFIASRISENFVDVGMRTRFFYQEDSATNLVQYEVEESVQAIVDQVVPLPGGVISITYANAAIEANKCALILGSHYLITDRADLGIMLLAVTPCSFSLEGEGIFLNADYQGAGDYSGVTAYNSTLGVWTTAIDAAVVNGDVVFWDGLHYETTDATSVAGTDPSVNILAYTLLAKAGTNFGYIEEVDFILYDFANDSIIRRMDKRSNDINAENAYFQWGNNNVQAIVSSNSAIVNCINQRGSLVRCVFENQVNFILNNTHEGDITECTFGGKYTITANFTSGNYLTGCIVFPIEDVTFNSVDYYEDYELMGDYSTFEATIDMTNGVDYANASETITIPPIYQSYVGVLNLQNNSGATISKIKNLSTYRISRFNPKGAHTFTFNHTAISAAVPYDLVSDAAAANIIVGRLGVLESDFIEYESRNGSMNRRYNAVILA